MRSIFYRSALLYDALMLALYRGAFRRRLACIAELIESGSTVLELCCGAARLYEHVRPKGVRYTGLDKSPALVAAARRRGIDARVADVVSEPLPRGFDVIVLQASLYQFHPRTEELMAAMLAAARQLVIVSEPIQNLASAPSGLVAALARRLTDAGAGEGAFRFDAASLAAFMARYAERLERQGLIDGGREAYYVLRAGGRERRDACKRGDACR